MIIEKGKTYSLSNMYKKSFIEENGYTNSDGKYFERQIGWRSGNMLVCPVNDWEVEQIQELVDEGENRDHSDETFLTDFSEHEFDSTWDGCWEDYYTPQEEWREAFEEMRDAFFDDEELMDEHFDFGSYMENEHGYDMDDTSCYIQGPVLVEETEHQIEVDWDMYPEEDSNAES